MKNKTTDIRAPWLDDPAAEPAELKNTDTAAAADSIAPENADTAADPFDLAALRLDQSFVQAAGAQKLLLTVPVRKPNKQDFCRVHQGAEHRENLAVIELKDDREVYLLLPEVARNLPGEFVMVTMYTAINRQGVVFLWPVKLPAADGKIIGLAHVGRRGRRAGHDAVGAREREYEPRRV